MNYHFIAIGGAAMHNLAIALKLAGHNVTGSDDEIFEPSKGRLLKYGLLPTGQGWSADMIHTGLDAVILGMHARKENPELDRAHELGIPIHSFPSFLFEHAKDKLRIVIGGSHGKTSITSMIIHTLEKKGMKFDFMVGASIDGFDVMVRLSEDAEVMIFEGDEYLTSAIDPRPKFHIYRPHIAAISGIAWDHMNVFPTFENYIDQFRKFIELLPQDGKLFYAANDPVLSKLVSEFPDIDKHGYRTIKHFIADDHSICLGDRPKSLKVPFFGQHNLMNAEVARLICHELGMDDEEFIEAMTTFKGAGNRLECLRDDEALTLFRDFAHAPSKVRATVAAVRERFPGREFVACLELHTYSSLSKEFLPQYYGSMDLPDKACVLLDPHAFAWKKLPPFSESEVREGFGNEELSVLVSKQEIELFREHTYRPGQVWLFMSSGNFGGLDIGSFVAHP